MIEFSAWNTPFRQGDLHIVSASPPVIKSLGKLAPR